MKKILFAAGILLSGLSMAQVITFQDPKFKQALIDAGVDTNNTGEISVSEAAAVTELAINHKNIDVIRPDEIKHFTNLKKLKVHNNNLTTLDLRANKKLEFVDAYPSPKMVWLRVNDLPELNNLSTGGAAFKYLYAYNSPQIKRFGLHAPNYIGLNGEKESLDLSVYPDLEYVYLGGTKIRRVKIDNPKLERFLAEDAWLEYLDVSKAPKLKQLNVQKNLLRVLNVANGNNPNFAEFKADGGNGNLKCIKVDNGYYPPNSWTKNAGVNYNSDCGCDHPLFITDSKFFETVKTHDKDNNGVMCPKEADEIKVVAANNNDIYSLNGIEGMKNLSWFLTNNTKVKEVDLSKNTELTIVGISGNDIEYINTKNLSKLQNLSVSNIPAYDRYSPPFITGSPAEYPNLKRLNIENVKLGNQADDQDTWDLAKDLSQFPSLEDVTFRDYSYLTLYQLDDDMWNIQNATQIKSLELNNVDFGDLDINKLTKLEKLEVYNNKYITNIKLDKAVKLREVRITGNKKITSLDLSKNTDLGKDVYAGLFVGTKPGRVILKNNKLKSLNLANGVNYQITNVDLTGNPDLKCVKIDASFIPPATWEKDNQTAFSNNCGMGVAEVADQAFRMYPNPVQDVLHIDSDKTVESVTVYDANGRLVFTKEGVNQVNVSALHAGVYIVQVVVDGQKVSKKIIKK